MLTRTENLIANIVAAVIFTFSIIASAILIRSAILYQGSVPVWMMIAAFVTGALSFTWLWIMLVPKRS